MDFNQAERGLEVMGTILWHESIHIPEDGGLTMHNKLIENKILPSIVIRGSWASNDLKSGNKQYEMICHKS